MAHDWLRTQTSALLFAVCGAVRIIAFYAVMIFILHPAGCAWVIVCSIAVGRWRGQKTYLKYIPWLVMIIAFGLLSMQPLWRVMYGQETRVLYSAGAADYILYTIGTGLLVAWFWLSLI